MNWPIQILKEKRQAMAMSLNQLKVSLDLNEKDGGDLRARLDAAVEQVAECDKAIKILESS